MSISQIKKDLSKNPDHEILCKVLGASSGRGPTSICRYVLDTKCRLKIGKRKRAEFAKCCLIASSYPELRDISVEDSTVHCARAALWAANSATVDCLSHISKCPASLIRDLSDKITDNFDCETSLDDHCVLLRRTMRMDVVKFSFGTVDAHIALDKKRSELVVHAVANQQIGNGDFQGFLVWLKAKCAKENLNIVFADIINDRLAVHLVEKHAFKLRPAKHSIFKEAVLKLKQTKNR